VADQSETGVRDYTAWLFALAAAGSLLVYAVAGRGNSATVDTTYIILPLLALAAVSVVVALTWRPDTASVALARVAASSWGIMLTLFALSWPLWGALLRYGRWINDAWSLFAAFTGLAFAVLGLQVAFGRRSGRTHRISRLFTGGSIGLLALYLLRVAARLYASTRVSQSERLVGIVDELHLTLAVAALSALALLAGACAARCLPRKGEPA
jgi:hypothetical protein